jgi:SMC interacting uncharacterized protein involved in chromosome segregation
MDSRLEIVEKDVATLGSDVAELKARVQSIDIRSQSIELRLVTLDQRLTDELPHLATRAELEKLRNEIRLWIIGSWITMFFSMAALQIALINLAKP